MFQRKPLREDVQDEILKRIVDGRLAAGSRINETHLAADMGLSRTPLREAMIILVARQFLKSDMGRGFAVPALDPALFKDIQAMLSQLEPFALSGASTLGPQTVMELNNLLNRCRMKLGKDPVWPEQAQALTVLVFQFSNLVIGHSRNELLRNEILRLQGLASRFWFHVARRGYPFEDLLTSYSQLYELLRMGQTEGACAHWRTQTLSFSEAAQDILAQEETALPPSDSAI